MTANIFFGSQEVAREIYKERVNPYSGNVVSKVAFCDENDALKALKIAKAASFESKKVTLAMRCDWLLDVANKLEQNAEDMAMTITDEVGKPITFSRIEVRRCVETIRISAETMRTMHGETDRKSVV